MAKIPPIIYTVDAVSVCGSVINGRHPPHDIDLLIRNRGRLYPLEEALARHFSSYSPDFIYAEKGPNWDYIPIGDFFLFPSGEALPDVRLSECPDCPDAIGLIPILIARQFVSIAPNNDLIFRSLETLSDSGTILKLRRLLQHRGELIFNPTAVDGEEPLADLVFIPKASTRAVRLPEPELKKALDLVESQQVTESSFLTDPLVKIEPMKAKTGYSTFEFFTPDDFWNIWGKTNIEKGFYLEPKVDGIRIIGVRKGEHVVLYTEDKRRERQDILPDVSKALENLPDGDIVLDGELVWFRDNKPINRWEMSRIVNGKEPIRGEDLRWFVFDCLYYDGKPTIDRPIEERVAALDSIVPRKEKGIIRRLPSYLVRSKRDLDRYYPLCLNFPSSEGAMAKLVASKYDVHGRTGEWAKIKAAKEIHAQVIGVMRKAGPWDKKPTRSISGKEALQAYKKLQKDSKTYLLRCAIRGEDGKLIPISSDKRLTESDLSVRWNAELASPSWQGLDDPALWEMDASIPSRNVGDYAFGNTYGRSFESPPKIGDIVVVRPMDIRIVEKDGQTLITWMFPIPHHIDETRSAPDSIDDIKHMAVTEAMPITVEESIRPPFAVPGSRNYLVPLILANIPPHKRYVELIARSAPVFFAKDKSQEEILNNPSSEIYYALKAIARFKDVAERLAKKEWRFSRARFTILKQETPVRDIDKLYRFLYLSYYSLLADRRTISPYIDDRKPVIEARLSRLNDAHQRLQGVTLLKKDPISVLLDYDNEDTFFLINSPFQATPYEHPNYDRLQEYSSRLQSLKGKFILITRDNERVREAFNNCYVIKLTVSPRTYGQASQVTRDELLIANFEPTLLNYRSPTVNDVTIINQPTIEEDTYLTGTAVQVSCADEGDSSVAEEPAHAVVTHATREEQRKAFEKSLGDWYMVESDKVLPSRIQYHIRGIPIGQERDNILKALHDASDQKALDKLWHKASLVRLKSSLQEIRNAVQKADDNKLDVTGALRQFIDPTPPPYKEIKIDDIYTIGSVHGDWRKPHPSMDRLTSSWTCMVLKTCLYHLASDKLFFPLRDRLIENQREDTFLSTKKCPSPIDPDEDALLPHILRAVPTLASESVDTLLSVDTESVDHILDTRDWYDAVLAIWESIQPILWLNLVTNKRKVVNVPAHSLPEGEGETLAQSSRFIYVAETKMVYGTLKSGQYYEYFHFFQDFNDDVAHGSAESLDGRWNWRLVPGRAEYTKAGSEEFWLGFRPWESQVPYILTHDKEEEEEKARRDKISLIWNEKSIELLRSLGYEHLTNNGQSK